MVLGGGGGGEEQKKKKGTRVVVPDSQGVLVSSAAAHMRMVEGPMMKKSRAYCAVATRGSFGGIMVSQYLRGCGGDLNGCGLVRVFIRAEAVVLSKVFAFQCRSLSAM